jgi:hypothetical protein
MGIKPNSFIANPYPDPAFIGLNVNVYFADSGVPCDIGQRFLHDAVGGCFNTRRKSLFLQSAMFEDHSYLELTGVAAELPCQCRQQAEVIQHGRPKLQRQVAYATDQFSSQSECLADAAFGTVRRLVRALLKGKT